MACEPLSLDDVGVVLQSLRRSTEFSPESYKAWHSWAMVNFEAVSRSANAGGLQYVVPAIGGFFRSIALGRERALQDMLRLLTLWFKYGATAEVDIAVQNGFDAIAIDTWLSVTPQIIAHIHSPNMLLRRYAVWVSNPRHTHYYAVLASNTVAERTLVPWTPTPHGRSVNLLLSSYLHPT